MKYRQLTENDFNAMYTLLSWTDDAGGRLKGGRELSGHTPASMHEQSICCRVFNYIITNALSPILCYIGCCALVVNYCGTHVWAPVSRTDQMYVSGASVGCVPEGARISVQGGWLALRCGR